MSVHVYRRIESVNEHRLYEYELLCIYPTQAAFESMYGRLGCKLPRGLVWDRT